MAQRDPMERITKIVEQQRQAVEEAFERIQKTGRKMADTVADAVKRAAPNDDLRATFERLEAQQREIATRWEEAQRQAIERLTEATQQAQEFVWSAIRGALDEVRGGSQRNDDKGGKSGKKAKEAKGAVTAAPVATEAPAAPAATSSAPAATGDYADVIEAEASGASPVKKGPAAKKAPAAKKPGPAKKGGPGGPGKKAMG